MQALSSENNAACFIWRRCAIDSQCNIFEIATKLHGFLEISMLSLAPQYPPTTRPVWWPSSSEWDCGTSAWRFVLSQRYWAEETRPLRRESVQVLHQQRISRKQNSRSVATAFIESTSRHDQEPDNSLWIVVFRVHWTKSPTSKCKPSVKFSISKLWC